MDAERQYGQTNNGRISNRTIQDSIKNYRERFETLDKFRYDDGTGFAIWAFGLMFTGIVTTLTSIGLSSYTTHIYWTTHAVTIPEVNVAVLESMPGTVFGISVAAFVATALIQLASYKTRRNLNAKDQSENGKKDLSLCSFIEILGYLTASSALALGYFCAQTALGSTAMTWQIAAITGAITGAIIALPSIAIGPCKDTQGTMPHIVDILGSAVAGAVALGTAHILTEKFFLHMLGTAAVDPALTAVMHMAIAMPIFALVKILLSGIGYEGIMTCMAHCGVQVGQEGSSVQRFTVTGLQPLSQPDYNPQAYNPHSVNPNAAVYMLQPGYGTMGGASYTQQPVTYHQPQQYGDYQGHQPL